MSSQPSLCVSHLSHDHVQVWYPLLRFREEGMATFSVGPEEGKVYTSKKGYPCKADKTIDSVTSKVGLHLQWVAMTALL